MKALLLATLAGGFFLSLSPVTFAAEHEVQIMGYKYDPAELTIKRGDTVVWVNREKRVSHSVLFTGSGEESERFFPDEKWSRVFDEVGRFEYRCGPHPEMLGVVIVND